LFCNIKILDTSKDFCPHPNPLPKGEAASGSLSLWERVGVRAKNGSNPNETFFLSKFVEY